LFAYSGPDVVGRSERISIGKRRTRRGVAIADIADAEGPWFDGVEYLKAKDGDEVFVAQAKSKTIGILGGGMAGLMSSVCRKLESAWLRVETDWIRLVVVGFCGN
jgi:hypothetical protein